MKTLVQFLRRQRDDGATMVEYALLVGLIGLACVAAIGSVGNDLKNIFGTIAAQIANQNTNAR